MPARTARSWTRTREGTSQGERARRSAEVADGESLPRVRSVPADVLRNASALCTRCAKIHTSTVSESRPAENVGTSP